jgi:hypothetical protein
MFAISVGAMLLVLSRQNRLQDVAPTKGSGLFIYTGGVFVLLGSVFLLEYIFTNEQHSARFFICVCVDVPRAARRVRVRGTCPRGRRRALRQST